MKKFTFLMMFFASMIIISSCSKNKKNGPPDIDDDPVIPTAMVKFNVVSFGEDISPIGGSLKAVESTLPSGVDSLHIETYWEEDAAYSLISALTKDFTNLTNASMTPDTIFVDGVNYGNNRFVGSTEQNPYGAQSAIYEAYGIGSQGGAFVFDGGVDARTAVGGGTLLDAYFADNPYHKLFMGLSPVIKIDNPAGETTDILMNPVNGALDYELILENSNIKYTVTFTMAKRDPAFNPVNFATDVFPQGLEYNVEGTNFVHTVLVGGDAESARANDWDIKGRINRFDITPAYSSAIADYVTIDIKAYDAGDSDANILAETATPIATHQLLKPSLIAGETANFKFIIDETNFDVTTGFNMTWETGWTDTNSWEDYNIDW